MSKHVEENRFAFTLIELLVVIAIIAILAAMLLPALRHARDKAKSAGCLNNIKQLSVAISMYADDNRGFLPYKLGGTEPRDLESPPNGLGLGFLLTGGYTGPRQRSNGVLDVYECPRDSTYWGVRWTDYNLRSYSSNPADPGFNVRDLRAGLSLLSDTWWTGLSDPRMPTHRNGYNVMFGDGSCKFYPDPDGSIIAYANAFLSGSVWTEFESGY